MEIGDPKLISIISDECDVLIHKISVHDNKYVDLIYDFNFSPISLHDAHIRKKSKISELIKNNVEKESYEIIRIHNKELSKNRIKAHYIRREKDYDYQMERGDNEQQQNISLGVMPSVFANCSIPTKKTYIKIIDKNGNAKSVESNEHVTVNGNKKLYMNTVSEIGLPFGPMARLIMSYATNQVISTKERKIPIGNSFSDFMTRVGYKPTGGKNGNINKFKDQLFRLSACHIMVFVKNEKMHAIKGFKIIDESYISLDSTKDLSFFEENNYFKISDDIYKMLTDSNVPYDMNVMDRIKHNPLMMDIYIWFVYKCHVHDKRIRVSWDGIILQFGSNYKRRSDFITNFMATVKKLEKYIVTGISCDRESLFINPNAKGIIRISQR